MTQFQSAQYRAFIAPPFATDRRVLALATGWPGDDGAVNHPGAAGTRRFNPVPHDDTGPVDNRLVGKGFILLDVDQRVVKASPPGSRALRPREEPAPRERGDHERVPPSKR